jgi:hypothetical protein
VTLVRKETRFGHSYRLDGEPVKGVTSLLSAGLPKPALPRWAAKTVAEWVADNPDQVDALRTMGRGPMIDALKAVPWQARDTAAARGTDIHAIADDLIHGREVEVPEHLLGYVNGYVQWLDHTQAEVIWTERPCASRKWQYAGTFDAIVRIGDRTALLDWKTSTGVYGDNACQISAYANAEFLLDHDGNEVPMPPVDDLGIVHIRPDGTDLYYVTDPEAAWKDFLHIQYVGKAADRIKDYLKLEQIT